MAVPAHVGSCGDQPVQQSKVPVRGRGVQSASIVGVDVGASGQEPLGDIGVAVFASALQRRGAAGIRVGARPGRQQAVDDGDVAVAARRGEGRVAQQ